MSVSDKPSTLRAQMKHHEPIVCYAVKTKQIDMRTSNDTAHPLDGNDDKEPQAVCYSPPAAFMGGQGAKARSIAYCDDGTTPTIKSVMSGGNTVPDVVYPINLMVATIGGRDDIRTDGVCYALEGNTVDRSCSQNGKGWCENVSPSLNTQDIHAVVFRKVCKPGSDGKVNDGKQTRSAER